jgi:hypothetical protein
MVASYDSRISMLCGLKIRLKRPEVTSVSTQSCASENVCHEGRLSTRLTVDEFWDGSIETWVHF